MVPILVFSLNFKKKIEQVFSGPVIWLVNWVELECRV